MKKLRFLLAITSTFLLSTLFFYQNLNARGNQFKGILPEKHHLTTQETTRVEAGEAIPATSKPTDSNNTPNVYQGVSLVVNIPARTVTLYDDGREVALYDIAIGQPIYKTPAGPQQIDTIIWNPWWNPPDSPWAKGAKDTPPGPNNPLGPVKLPMGQGIRLHGTNKDSSVGHAASHGCLRMHNEDAVSLAWFIQKKLNVTTEDAQLDKYKKNRYTSFYVRLDSPVPVSIIYKPVEIRNEVIIIYPDIYGWAKNIKSELIDTLVKSGIDIKHINFDKLTNLKYPARGNGELKINLTDILSSSTQGMTGSTQLSTAAY